MNCEYDSDDIPLRVHVSGSPKGFQLVERVNVTCTYCGKTFQQTKNEKPKQFCSGTCSYAYKRAVKDQIERGLDEKDWKETQEIKRKKEEQMAKERKPIIERLRAEGKSWTEIAQFFEDDDQPTL